MKKKIAGTALTMLVVISSASMGMTAEKDSDINVSVQRECQVTHTNFDPPGTRTVTVNGTEMTLALNVIGANETDDFYIPIYNTGNRNATVTVNLTVTNESDYFKPPEPMGPFINLSKQEDLVDESYEPFSIETTYYIPEDEGPINNTFFPISKLFKAMYPTGGYAGHLRINYSCENIDYDKNISDYNNFKIITSNIVTAAGRGPETGGEKGDIPTETAFPALANFTGNITSNTTSPRDANKTGNYTSNVTAPEDVGREGNATTNVTLPQDVNRTGEESNQSVPEDVNRTGESSNLTTPADANNTGAESNRTIEEEANRTGEEGEEVPGGGDQPGETPEPDPSLIIDIEPVKDAYIANRTQYSPVTLNISNSGERHVADISIQSLIDDIRPGWEVRDASIANLTAGESVTRKVFVRPPSAAETDLYVSPVAGVADEERVDIDYFTLDVRKTDFNTGMVIQEAPRSVNVQEDESVDIPFLVENTGEKPVENVTAEFQNVEDCGTVESGMIGSIPVNESGSLQASFNASSNVESCNSTVILSSAQGDYAFTNINFSVRPEGGLIPPKQRVPFIAVLWTSVLALYAVLRKRLSLDTAMTKAPLILLMMGETVIILYLAVSYYGIIEAAFLPF